MKKSWGEYYENTKDLRPSEHLIRAHELYDPVPSQAIDLGCGAGRDTRFLLEKGYNVTAVDQDYCAEVYIKKLPHQDRLEFIRASFDNFEFKKYNLINAHYALPFMKKTDFDAVIDNILDAINPDGLFVGQLFGIDDAWNMSDSTMTFCSRSDIEKLFGDFKHVEIDEINEMGTLANGDPKHWHVFNIIAQK